MCITKEYLGLMVSVTINNVTTEGILIDMDKDSYHLSLDGGFTCSLVIPRKGSTIVCEELVESNGMDDFYDKMADMENTGIFIHDEPILDQ